MARINHSKLLEIQKTLQEVPKVKTYNTQEALNALKNEIYALRKKGYDSKEIAKFLKDTGLFVSVAKIKQILAPEAMPSDHPTPLGELLDPSAEQPPPTPKGD